MKTSLNNLLWTQKGWDDYLYWQEYDPKTLQRVNQLIKEIMRSHFVGIGKPEPLRGNLSGWWSRRITAKHRLVYKIEGDKIILLQCLLHYQ